MTGKRLMEELQKLSPKEQKYPIICFHTEYSNIEDSIGYEVEIEFDSIEVRLDKIEVR